MAERTVFDGGDTGGDGVAHAWGAMGMGGDTYIQPAGFFGDGAHFGFRILRSEQIRRRGGGAPGGKHLDKICSRLDLSAHGTPHVGLRIRFDAAEPQVPARGGDAIAGGDNAWPWQHAALDGVPHRKGDTVAGAAVAYGGAAGAQRQLHIFHRANQFGFVGFGLVVGKDVGAGAE